jgi:hypothetical protein
MKFILFFTISLLFQPLYADIFKELGTIDEDFSGNFEQNKWSEEITSMPELPDEQHLIEFNAVASYSQYRYAIDEKTLSVGKKDAVVRFIMVISSPSGVKSSYYQGLNCSKKQIKTYAYSSANKFITSSQPSWKELSDNGVLGYSEGLAEFYFCGFPYRPLTRIEILNNLKYGNERPD